MRIALISHEYPQETGNGGIGTYVHQAAHMLTARGHEVEVFAGATTSTRSLQDGPVLLHRVLPASRADFHKAVAPIFAERHRQKAFDIVEGPEFRADTLSIQRQFPDLPIAIKLHTPSFLLRRLFRGKISLGQKVRFMGAGLLKGQLNKPYWTYDKTDDPEYASAQLSPTILHPSLSLGQIVQETWDIPKERFLHLPYPFKPSEAFLKIPIEASGDGIVRVTFIGKLEPRKGILPLSEAIPALCKKYPQVRFRFIGKSLPSGKDGQDMQSYLLEKLAPYRDQLEFTGPVPYDRIPAMLAETAICIYPSLWENFPNVCLEGMSAGRAVIGSQNGGMAEMLGKNEYGLIVDPHDPLSIQQALETFIQDEALRLEKGRAARQRILNTYTVEVIGARTERVYQQIIERWPQPV